ncbi:MAG: hypothetical protein KGV46_01935 [Pasteurella sp.]|nr:hypothetical protein [Pasteurella sp.]
MKNFIKNIVYTLFDIFGVYRNKEYISKDNYSNQINLLNQLKDKIDIKDYERNLQELESYRAYGMVLSEKVLIKLLQSEKSTQVLQDLTIGRRFLTEANEKIQLNSIAKSENWIGCGLAIVSIIMMVGLPVLLVTYFGLLLGLVSGVSLSIVLLFIAIINSIQYRSAERVVKLFDK